MKKNIQEIAKLDGRYSLRAFEFVQEGLARTVTKHHSDEIEDEGPHHVTGKQLCWSLAELAVEKWGRMARVVLNYLGVNSTYDFGHIVYLMVEHKWMYARPEDSIEEFKDVYDFENVFENFFKFS
ncbi:MAG: hypothetical protein A2173_09135 [Planctomycetes bacterium RBG_13_44_8b]|nr:MAG: hypothetical protein A2173_09135 [Planctomycetes bacterium RBG_13_44_8b]